MFKDISIHNTSSFLSSLVSADDTSAELHYPSPNIPLSGEIAPGWWLKHPILLDVEMGEGGEYVVSYDAFDTYGVGATPQEAVAEFASMLIDLYQELDSDEKVLSPYLRSQLERLRGILLTD